MLDKTSLNSILAIQYLLYLYGMKFAYAAITTIIMIAIEILIAALYRYLSRAFKRNFTTRISQSSSSNFIPIERRNKNISSLYREV